MGLVSAGACAQASRAERAGVADPGVYAISTEGAQAPQVERIDVVEYGIYTTTTESAQAAPDAPGGTIKHTGNIRHAATTRVVPAQLGVEFGFRFNVVGTPAGAKVPLHVLAYFPPPGLNDTENKKQFNQAGYDRTDAIGPGGYLSYTFDHDWELVPGVWTLQIWNDGRMLVEQKFTVVKQ
jgi:hypothetical protein